ncbi:MAG: hypothetical protein JXX14_15045 [Deltaproteobacteria bacterium]|nr:hypothetical protein [Deltaproteobacteria bacterium]
MLRATRFRIALESIPARERDGWLDEVLGLDSLAEDGPDLPRGCVPYIPCPVEILLQMIDASALDANDVFVDIGAGPGRATALVHLLTGASAIGIEVQAGHVQDSIEMTRSLGMERVTTVHGDAVAIVRHIPIGTVFFLYCPFSHDRLENVFDELAAMAVTRPIRICCVHVPPIRRDWLRVISAPVPGLTVYESLGAITP